MPRTRARKKPTPILPQGSIDYLVRIARRGLGLALGLLFLFTALALATFDAGDPTLNNATGNEPANLMGALGAQVADLLLQTLGLAAVAAALPLATWGWRLVTERGLARFWLNLVSLPVTASAWAAAAAVFAAGDGWPLESGYGGVMGQIVLGKFDNAVFAIQGNYLPPWASFMLFAALGSGGLVAALGLDRDQWRRIGRGVAFVVALVTSRLSGRAGALPGKKKVRRKKRKEPRIIGEVPASMSGKGRVAGPKKMRRGGRDFRERQENMDFGEPSDFKLPTLDLLKKPKITGASDRLSQNALEQNARLLESVLDDFGIQGEIGQVRPGPVVTMYELVPAAGVKSSRVISLAGDIARSMSAVSARIAVVPGRNVIGIELPNSRRETVYLRELLSSSAFENSNADLALALGKDITGSPVIADLAAMPHLLVAGTTGSGKSVGLNAMILSLLYRLPPDRCKMIMVDPKMLELSVYDDIPHLLTPVVTEPKKAVVALKWAVHEMEERYRAMSKLGVRTITAYNKKVGEARANGEIITRRIQTGFDKESGQPVYEKLELDLEPFPLIVVVIDEMADLMLVAGKDVEATVQRLSQMARAAGVHLIMATQRPSVDVITGTIKANFPTRISFQVTSKIDSRTILGEQGAEQLLGEGDMLYMASGGRVTRVHGPFVSDQEVEKVVSVLKKSGRPQYLSHVTEEPDGGFISPYLPGGGSSTNELYDKAVDIVLRDRKASTSYIQRRLKIGYNRAATLIEEMEDNGVISGPNHAGRREVLPPATEE